MSITRFKELAVFYEKFGQLHKSGIGVVEALPMASMHASSVMNGKRSWRTGERHGRISRSRAPPASARRSSHSALARHIEHSPS